MGPRARAHQDLVELLRICADTHHGDRGAEFFTDQAPLPIDGLELPAATGLVLDIAQRLFDAQQGRCSASSALARTAVHLATTLHRALCPPGTGRDRALGLACSRDARVARDALVLLAARFLDLEFQNGITDACERALAQVGLTPAEMNGALHAILADGTQPLWDRRRPPSLSPDFQVVQFNTAISKVTGEFSELRQLGLRARDEFTSETLHLDITSDYARPETRETKLVDGGAVRSAILHACGMVVVTRYGRFGTAMSWTRAEDLLMPVLVLSHEDDGDVVARYPGGLALRDPRTYRTEDEAVAEVAAFLERHRHSLDRRHAALLDYASRDITLIQDRANTVDLSVFDTSAISWQLVRFHTSTPVHWFQAPPEQREEILRRFGLPVQGAPGEPAQYVAEPTDAVSNVTLADYDRSMQQLTRYAEIAGLSWERFDHLREVWRAEQQEAMAVSARPAPYSVADWRALDARTPNRPAP